jgi:hypothetical protein
MPFSVANGFNQAPDENNAPFLNGANVSMKYSFSAAPGDTNEAIVTLTQLDGQSALTPVTNGQPYIMWLSDSNVGFGLAAHTASGNVGEASGDIASTTVNTGGVYTVVPDVSFDSPAGFGATAHALMEANASETVNPGNGYVPNNTIVVNGGTFTVACTLTVNTTQLVSGAVSVTGQNYLTGDTYTGTGGTHSISPVLTITSTGLVSLNLVDPGENVTPGLSFELEGATFTSPPILQATTTQLVSLNIVSGGNGYSNGEIITLAGGTHSAAAEIIVASVDGGGAVTGYTLFDGGSYTVNTGSFTQASSSGSGTGFTANNGLFGLLDFTIIDPGVCTAESDTLEYALDGITFNSASYGMGTFDITNGGSFTVNASTITQGSTSGSGTGGQVSTTSYGVLDTTPTVVGLYSVLPTNPVSQTSTSGSGVGFTGNLNYAVSQVPMDTHGDDYETDSTTVVFDPAGATATANIAGNSFFGTLTAKKAFVVQPGIDGGLKLSITDSSKTGYYICAQCPYNGQVFISDQLITADYG